ncbi:MAG: ACT domain-containing protein [Gammaproteobacteria bacterium]|nr:ACT domain-containing protein [Gammaproteobacteria bacterium]
MSTNLDELLRSLEPRLNAGEYVFVTPPAGRSIEPATTVAFIREAEGDSVVMAAAAAAAAGYGPAPAYAWISLSVQSGLQAVGLTAAFAQVLAAAGIGCNVIAGARHDHLFVPSAKAQAALAALRALQRQHARARAHDADQGR